jgi:pimeloyl-ACP methyl ester carboxylesterase
MLTESDVVLADGRTLHVYDTGRGSRPVFWLHGTPNIGVPPEPLFAAADRLGVRWVGYDRPGYGTSTPRPGRDVASAAGDVAAVADALGIDSFGVIGHSGGGPHALACAALLAGRVRATAAISTLAPYGADGLDWFAGMAPGGVAGLRAAVAGRAAKQRYEQNAGDVDPGFTAADWDALKTDWSWFLTVVEPALTAGPGPLVDDDLAYVAPWGFDPAAITGPTLLLHGAEDRVAPVAHAAWLAERCPAATLRVEPGQGHVSVMRSAGSAVREVAAALQP